MPESEGIPEEPIPDDEEPKSLDAEEVGEEGQDPATRPGGSRFTDRFKRGLVSVAKATYDARADDLQDRAVNAMRAALQQESARLIEVAKLSYDDRADDLESRAVRATRKVFDEEADRLMGMARDAYDSRADDIEERAARALRAALIHESRRIEALIERSVVVKRKEVRLSMGVLVFANLLYLLVYKLTEG